jgi:hypothetical protein
MLSGVIHQPCRCGGSLSKRERDYARRGCGRRLGGRSTDRFSLGATLFLLYDSLIEKCSTLPVVCALAQVTRAFLFKLSVRME